jgi:hypothetical protein
MTTIIRKKSDKFLEASLVRKRTASLITLGLIENSFLSL